ncbi:hypothetical protein IIA79_00300 [bacterium]|nr:hypothetical protein [bacterium]
MFAGLGLTARILLATTFLAILALGASCTGGINPRLGAALIFEEQITDNIKARIILRDPDLLDDEDEERYWYY